MPTFTHTPLAWQPFCCGIVRVSFSCKNLEQKQQNTSHRRRQQTEIRKSYRQQQGAALCRKVPKLKSSYFILHISRKKQRDIWLLISDIKQLRVELRNSSCHFSLFMRKKWSCARQHWSAGQNTWSRRVLGGCPSFLFLYSVEMEKSDKQEPTDLLYCLMHVLAMSIRGFRCTVDQCSEDPLEMQHMHPHLSQQINASSQLNSTDHLHCNWA